MLTADTVRFIEGGCALIVGGVHPDGSPYATRGWGAQVLDPERGRLRLLLSSLDDTAAELLRDGRPIAITGADVPTLRSMQLKGTASAIEPGTDEDRARSAAYQEAFFRDIEQTDGTPYEVVHLVRPPDVIACLLEVREGFDQTPGPGAGGPLVRPS